MGEPGPFLFFGAASPHNEESNAVKFGKNFSVKIDRRRYMPKRADNA
jgi:hypothetical protein